MIEQDDKAQDPVSFGEQLVGITFNPSNDSKVALIKSKFAEIANLVHEDFQQTEKSELANILYKHTVGELLNAQMNAVKLITLQY